MKKYLLLALLLLANAYTLFAQGPGDPGCPDPDNCPIDTWVIAFAAVVLIITTVYLHKKQTSQVKIQ